MPLQATSGAASYDAFGGGVPVVPQYIEEVFQTWLYTGTGASLTITNNIDLSTKGGMVWFKNRNGTFDHSIFDTARGVTKSLRPNDTVAESTETGGLTAFNTNGFTLGNWSRVNYTTSDTYASWTFRKQPKFFDVVAFTSSASGNKTFSHNLGAVPGCVIIKNTQTSDPWIVYHRSVGDNAYLSLNSTAAQDPLTGAFSATSTTFTISSSLMYNSQTYVAYLFAHDAGGFGLTGTDNVISCGSFTTDGSGDASVNLGYEPQWVMQKRTDSSTGGNWFMADNMRGMTVNGSLGLFPNLSNVEDTSLQGPVKTNATGFTASRFANATYIYIAIRRGPMKVPTSGTSVFSPITWTGNGTTGRTLATGLSTPPDLTIIDWRNATTANQWYDKLRGYSTTAAGSTAFLRSTSTNAEGTQANYIYIPDMVNLGFGSETTSYTTEANGTSSSMVGWNWKRAPSFFDEVCYTGTGSATTFSHNLGVVPELMIVKQRSTTRNWNIYSQTIGASDFLIFATDARATDSTRFNGTSPTSSVFSVGTSLGTNQSAGTYVAYLFATCAGVSKVFSYTGNGSSQTINCGFIGGARFVLIKRTDNNGDWYVWDSARGIVSGNDPHLSLNSTAAEVTTDDTIDTDSTGFVVNQVSATDVNVSSATYIGLAIA